MLGQAAVDFDHFVLEFRWTFLSSISGLQAPTATSECTWPQRRALKVSSRYGPWEPPIFFANHLTRLPLESLPKLDLFLWIMVPSMQAASTCQGEGYIRYLAPWIRAPLMTWCVWKYPTKCILTELHVADAFETPLDRTVPRESCAQSRRRLW